MGLPAWAIPVADLAFNVGSYLLSRHDAGHAQETRVDDMRRAGLNPMWMGAGQGAPVVSFQTPNLASDYSAGLAGERQPYAILEARARVQEILARAAKETNESALIADTKELKRMLLQGEVRLQDLTIDQKKQMFPLLVLQVKAETDASLGSARNANASAMLAELGKGKALNDSEWEELVGLLGPTGRVLRDLAKSVGAAALIGGLMR